MVTQSELAELYGLKLPLLSTVMKKYGVAAIGYKAGEKKMLRGFDEQEATKAIIYHLYKQMRNREQEYMEADKVLQSVLKVAKTRGIGIKELLE